MSPRRPTRTLRVRETQEYVGTEEYEQALEALSRMRRGASLSEAAASVGLEPRLVRRYVGSVLDQDEGGGWVALPNDRLYRRMRFLDEQGISAVEPANAREARKLSAYWRAVDRYLWKGDARPLREFRHKRLHTRQKTSLRFLTDLETIQRLAYAGEVSFEDLYARAI